MPRSLPRLPSLRLASMALVIGLWIGQVSSLEAQAELSGFGDRVGQGGGKHADRILQESISRLESAPSVSAQIRQRVTVLGESLVGSGAYQQATYGADCLLRLDLKIPLGADQVSTLIQVADGRFIWTYRLIPDTHLPPQLPNSEAPELGRMEMRTEMTRVDLNKVRTDSRLSQALAYGGLPHLLRQVGQHYDLESATLAELQGVPVWNLRGQCARADTKDKKGAEEKEETAWERGVLRWTLLMIGQDDFFPYRVEFCNELPQEGAAKDSMIVSARRRQAISMDFFEVQIGVPIDPRVFVFKPRDHRVDDVTQDYLAALQDRTSRSAGGGASEASARR